MNRSGSSRALLAGMSLFTAFAGASCGHCPEHDGNKKGGVFPPPPTPEAERHAFVTRIQKSGELPPDLKPIVQAAADGLFEQTFGRPSPTMERPQPSTCFQHGCIFDVVYTDACVLSAFTRRLSENGRTPLRRWPGGIYKSPSRPRKDGRIDVTWALIINDAKKDREHFATAVRPTDEPSVFVPDRCGAGSPTPAPAPPAAASPSEVK